tara:strand:- start:779 stop:1264 length:486 start_codon:yes stop_codon:yes gene_type:complete
MSAKDKLINLLKENNCIFENKDLELSSGFKSNIYYDIKKAAGIPETFSFIVNELKNIIPKNSSIVSVSTGGIPYGAALSYEYKNSFAYVRSNRKAYGMKNMIEGYIDYNKPIYILDDVCTTGSSIIKARNTIGLNEKECFLVCIVNRSKHKLNISSIIELK